jgi:phosphodiesterase/alkaline phosphatase D-like protein
VSTNLSWTTNELASARVYYSTSPLQWNEGDIRGSGFAVYNGQITSTDNNLRTNHSVNLTGLNPNTMYYYMVVATDVSGNISVSAPGESFRTNNN